MSATVTEPVTVSKFGKFKFSEPDLTIGPEERELFVLPTSKKVEIKALQLHDYRKAKQLKRGSLGLSEHGFTLVNHTSALQGNGWYSESNVESTYYAEVQSLVTNLTGARKVLITNTVLRRRPDEEPLDSAKYMERDEEKFEETPGRIAKPLLIGLDSHKPFRAGTYHPLRPLKQGRKQHDPPLQ